MYIQFQIDYIRERHEIFILPTIINEKTSILTGSYILCAESDANTVLRFIEKTIRQIEREEMELKETNKGIDYLSILNVKKWSTAYQKIKSVRIAFEAQKGVILQKGKNHRDGIGYFVYKEYESEYSKQKMIEDILQILGINENL